MGITVHFMGRLRGDDDYRIVTGLGREFAQRKGAIVFELDVSKKELFRVKNGEVVRTTSPVRGIRFTIHPASEPITLQFDSDNYLQESCKTQYAGISVHLEVLAFLREIEPHFTEFKVIDEGGFWETGDISALEENFMRMQAALGMLGSALGDPENPPDPPGS